MNITAHVNIKEMRKIKDLIAFLKRGSFLQEVASYAVSRLEHHSPPSLQGGWYYTIQGGRISFLHNSVEEKILWYLELGTVAHRIEPVNASVLHWVTDTGEDAFSKGHMVSGIQAHRFWEKTKKDVEQFVEQKTKMFRIT